MPPATPTPPMVPWLTTTLLKEVEGARVGEGGGIIEISSERWWSWKMGGATDWQYLALEPYIKIKVGILWKLSHLHMTSNERK